MALRPCIMLDPEEPPDMEDPDEEPLLLGGGEPGMAGVPCSTAKRNSVTYWRLARAKK